MAWGATAAALVAACALPTGGTAATGDGSGAGAAATTGTTTSTGTGGSGAGTSSSTTTTSTTTTSTTTTSTTSTSTTTTSTTTTSTTGTGGSPPMLVCADVAAHAACVQADPVVCRCLGCNNNNFCASTEDCVCPDCQQNAACLGCNGGAPDGECDPYNETCDCADCAAHSLCP